MRLRELLACTACLWLLFNRAPGHASPGTSDAANALSSIRLDANGRPAYLARFHDGPRNVPVAQGAAHALAQELGIGSAASARALLSNRPARALLQALARHKPTTLLWPVVHGQFGRGFGFTRTIRKDLPHNGIDIGAEAGTPVRAAASGLVVYSDNGLRGYGNCVMILHDGGLLTLYAHNTRTTVQAGQRVEQGESIAQVGQTGYAWGPHLHFELRDNSRLRDPMPLMVGKRSDLLLHADAGELQ